MFDLFVCVSFVYFAYLFAYSFVSLFVCLRAFFPFFSSGFIDLMLEPLVSYIVLTV